MIGMLISAYSIGLLISVPPGAITVATVQRSFANGARNALIFNVGMTASDVLYLLFIYFGLYSLIDGSELLRLTLLLLSGLWMGWMGFSAVRQQLQIEESFEHRHSCSNWQSFLTGFVMNLVNPLTVIGWAAIAGNFFTSWSLHWPPIMPFGLFAIALMLVGTLSWQLLLILLACFVRDLIKPAFVRTLSIGGGTLLMMYGAGAWVAALGLIV